MPLKRMSLRRPSAMLRMPAAIASGMKVSAFIKKMARQGLSYRKTTMLQDWAGIAGIERKKDRQKYTRRDRIPKMKEIADVPWKLSKEYMHRAAVFSRVAPGEPLVKNFVNIMSDKRLTGQQIIEEVGVRWEQWDRDSSPERLERVIPTDVFHRVSSPTA